MRRSALGVFLLVTLAGCAQTPSEPYEPKNTTAASTAPKKNCVSTGSHVKGKCSSGSTYSNAEAMKTQDTSVTIRKSPTGPTAK
jgi:hypothetical protein